MSYTTLKHFGLPLGALSLRIDTSDRDDVKTHIEGCILNKNIANIVGPKGAGKTTAVRMAVDALNADKPKKPIKLVKPLTLDRERMRIGSIIEAFFYDLQVAEAPKRSAEARMSQLRRILGDAAKEYDILLVVEESHLTYKPTLRSLKGLMELEWAGRGPLLSIALVGQLNPLTVPSLAEIAKPPRSNLFNMRGLSADEARDYINRTVGQVWDAAAVDALVKDPAARNYLDLQETLLAAMVQAQSEGKRQVLLTHLYEATDAGLKGMVEAMDIPLKEIASVIGKDKSQTSRILSGERDDPVAKDRIRQLLNQKQRESVGSGAAVESELMRKVG